MTKNKKYPMGGVGLKDVEEEKLKAMLHEYGFSLKYLQRALLRKFIRGEIVFDTPKVIK